jgi:hypothetical protein
MCIRDRGDIDGQSMAADEFLNMRSDLSKISDFDKNVPADELARLAREMRDDLNAGSRDNIRGLKALDDEFGPMKQDVDLIKKRYIDRSTGELKPTMTSQVASLNNKGKELIRAEMVNTLGKSFADKFFEDVNILNALEDVTGSNGIKVGTYTRTAIGGGAAATGNIPLLVGAIMASPTVAVKLLKLYGKSKGIANSTINKITSTLQAGGKLTPRQLKIVGDMVREADIAFKESLILPERAEEALPPTLAP